MQQLIWVGKSKNELMSLPEPVVQRFGYALALAQQGMKHDNAKPLKGFGGAGVLEIVADLETNTYRAVYTVKFANYIFVLHCFQKKSKHGIATPKETLDIIRSRLKDAQTIFQEME